LPLPEGLDMDKVEAESLEMVENIRLRTLVIHGEYDMLVAPERGAKTVRSPGEHREQLLVIPGADHNDIMFTGLNQYFDAIEKFTGTA